MHLGTKDLFHLMGMGSIGLTKEYLSPFLLISMEEWLFYHQRWFLLSYFHVLFEMYLPASSELEMMWLHKCTHVFCFYKYSSCEGTKILRIRFVKWMDPIECLSIFLEILYLLCTKEMYGIQFFNHQDHKWELYTNFLAFRVPSSGHCTFISN